MYSLVFQSVDRSVFLAIKAKYKYYGKDNDTNELTTELYYLKIQS